MSALAALAGSRTGNLGLASPADAYLKRLELDQKAAQADNATMMDMQKMWQQDRQFNRAQDLDREKLAMQREEADQNWEYKKALIGQLNAQVESSARDKKKEELEGMLSVSSAIASMDPNQLEENKAAVLNATVRSGLITEEQGQQLAGMSSKQLQTFAKAGVYVSKNALQMQMAQMKQQAGAGGTKVYDPNTGNLVYESQPLDKTNLTNTIKASTDADESLTMLKQIGDQYKKEYLGAGGAITGGVLKGRDWLSTFPGAGSLAELNPEQKDWLQGYSGFRSSVESTAMSVIKQLSGVQYSDKQLEFMRKIIPNPENSPSEFEGKFNSMTDRLGNLKGLKERLLKEGYSLNSEAYKDKYLMEAEKTLSAPVTKEGEGAIIGRDGKEYSRQMLEQFAKDNKMNVEDLIKRIK